LIESSRRFDWLMPSSSKNIARRGWRKRRQNAGKGRAIGIGGVSSTGDKLGAEARCYWIEARPGEDTDIVARAGATDKAEPIML
jgi:hypothetical protein